ncbi:MAG: hypothetical protein ACMVY4_00980 [Minwuia sp.]
MRRILLVMIAIIVLLVAGGVAFVAVTDIPAPTHEVRKVLPDENFEK